MQKINDTEERFDYTLSYLLVSFSSGKLLYLYIYDSQEEKIYSRFIENQHWACWKCIRQPKFPIGSFEWIENVAYINRFSINDIMNICSSNLKKEIIYDIHLLTCSSMNEFLENI